MSTDTELVHAGDVKAGDVLVFTEPEYVEVVAGEDAYRRRVTNSRAVGSDARYGYVWRIKLEDGRTLQSPLGGNYTRKVV